MWPQVEEVFQDALDQPEGERVRFIDSACGNDDLLRRETLSLLDAYDAATEFFAEPAIARDAYVLLGSDTEASPGQSIGPYTIVRRLGGGGMGDVYLAEDKRLGRSVALKILPEYFAGDPARLLRFQREARAASALNHPNIITIHEVGEHEQVHYIATEFIDGVTLRDLIKSGELTQSEAIAAVAQVASALDAAHRAGIVHRDVKPENIMRRDDGLVKILDFGIAKLVEPKKGPAAAPMQTEVGMVMGTVEYMSPEQARGLPVDQRSDVWSLGVVLYEVISGRLPFTGPTRMDAMVEILEREPLPLDDAAIGLQRVVAKALQKKPSNRYGTAAELLADLSAANEALDDVPITVRRPVPPSRAGSVVLLALLLIIGSLIGVFLYRRSKSHATTPATVTVPASLPYTSMNDSQRLAFIREEEQRISRMMGENPRELPPDALQTIKRHVDRYAGRIGNASTKVGSDSLEVIHKRAEGYVPFITRVFAERKVPVLIAIYLPMIESEYRPCIESPNGAKGIFQFIPKTAEHYGVPADQMCDVDKMAPAAANYVADRMAELGEDAQSMTLVLVSYNRGTEYVQSSLKQLRGEENYRRDFWTLFAHRNQLDESFRNETVGYVPAFFAAAIIGENPQRFGLSTPPLTSLAAK